MLKPAVLYYIHDPMCSWCWGYRPEWLKLKSAVQNEFQVISILGGLAPDSDQPMPPDMRQAIEGHWRKIQSMLGTQFNFDFWRLCHPRRDTYKANRAVVVADGHDLAEEMIAAIQHAYYLRAMNPSEPETLVQLAVEIGLDGKNFRTALRSDETETEFTRQIRLARNMGVSSFPSLVLKTANGINPVVLDYRDHRLTLEDIRSILS